MHQRSTGRTGVALIAWSTSLFAVGAIPRAAVAAQVEIELRDIGIRRHTGWNGSTAFVFDLNNSSSARFSGTLRSAPKIKMGRFPDEFMQRVVSRAVELAPGERSRVCLTLPTFVLRDKEVLEFDIADPSGLPEATARLEVSRQTVTMASGQVLVGVIGQTSDHVQAIQKALLYPQSLGAEIAVAPPRLKVLPLPVDALPACPEAWGELQFLVLAAASSALPSPVLESIKLAVTRGLRLVVIDSFPGNQTAFGHSVVLGRGGVLHASSIADEAAFGSIRKAASDEARDRSDGFSIEDALDLASWSRGRFLEAELPPAPAVVGVTLLYSVTVGPLCFFWLRARERREQAWLVMPVMALIGAAILWFGMRAYRFEGSRLDSVACQYSLDGQAAIRGVATMRLSTPEHRVSTLRVPGLWFPQRDWPSPAQTHELHWGQSHFEFRNLRSPAWSSQDLFLEGAREGVAPVSWVEGGIRNDLASTFVQALMIVGDEVYEADAIPPRSLWRFEEAARRSKLGMFVRPGPRRGHLGRLADALWFADQEQADTLTRQARAVFIGASEDDQLRASLTPPPSANRAWTLHAHVFPR